MVKIFPSKEEALTKIKHGKPQLIIIDGKKICLARFDEKFYAFDNACPHQHEPLNKGAVTKFEEIVCPLHYYRFNMTSGQETNNRCKSLELYQIELNDDGLFIKI